MNKSKLKAEIRKEVGEAMSRLQCTIREVDCIDIRLLADRINEIDRKIDKLNLLMIKVLNQDNIRTLKQLDNFAEKLIEKENKEGLV